MAATAALPALRCRNRTPASAPAPAAAIRRAVAPLAIRGEATAGGRVLDLIEANAAAESTCGVRSDAKVRALTVPPRNAGSMSELRAASGSALCCPDRYLYRCLQPLSATS